MKTFLERVIRNPRTTLGGTALGSIGIAVTHNILTQAGCHFEQVVWADALVFLFTQMQGAFSTDNGKGV